jgi:subtilisin family serine protease
MAAASRYIIELRQPGTVPTALLSAINAAGGTVSRFHNGVGMVMARHLSPAAATTIARRPEVQAMIPDRSIRWLPGQQRPAPGASELVQRAPAVFARAAVGARGDPHNAGFFKQGHQWNMTVIHADSAWEVTTQGAGVRVFILDTGADTAHQDLSGRVDGSRSTSFQFADTTDTGAISPFYVDSAGHGTIVSSIISSNGIGVASVAPQATLAMVKVLDARGSGAFSAVLSGILFAVDTGADVINMSLGAVEPLDDPVVLVFADVFQRIVDYGARKGVVVVVAAGNEAADTARVLSQEREKILEAVK